MSETALSTIAEINPGVRIPKDITGSDEVSFIPMSDVSESGDWTTHQTRPLRSVTAGFTAFEEGDVLVAKITPCLENGKGAHARALRNGIGFGSTEFHVLRARQGVEPRFVFHVTQSQRFRQAAERQMVGSAGQQRVQRQFFDEFLIRDFSSEEQIGISQILDTLDTAICETEALIDKLKAGRTHAEVPEPLQVLFRPSVQPYLISLFAYDPAEAFAAAATPGGAGASPPTANGARHRAKRRCSTRSRRWGGFRGSGRWSH